MQDTRENYLRAGGTAPFSDYYTADDDGAPFDRRRCARTSSSRSTTWPPTARSTSSTHPVPQRHDLLRPRAAGRGCTSCSATACAASGSSRSGARSRSGVHAHGASTRRSTRPRRSTGGAVMAVQLVAIGASWGGLHAVETLLGSLPADFGAAGRRRPASPRDHARRAPAALLRRALRAARRRGRGQAGPRPGRRARRAGRLPPARRARHARALGRRAACTYSRPSIDVLLRLRRRRLRRPRRRRRADRRQRRRRRRAGAIAPARRGGDRRRTPRRPSAARCPTPRWRRRPARASCRSSRSGRCCSRSSRARTEASAR